MNKKVKSLLVCGLVALSMVGCSKETVEERIEGQVKDYIESNIEKYGNYEDETGIIVAKNIDMDSIDVKVEETENNYEIDLSFESGLEDNEGIIIGKLLANKNINLKNINIIESIKNNEVRLVEAVVKQEGQDDGRVIVEGYEVEDNIETYALSQEAIDSYFYSFLGDLSFTY